MLLAPEYLFVMFFDDLHTVRYTSAVEKMQGTRQASRRTFPLPPATQNKPRGSTRQVLQITCGAKQREEAQPSATVATVL